MSEYIVGERTEYAFLLGAWGKLLLVIGHKLWVMSGLLQFCFCSFAAGGRGSERWWVSIFNMQQTTLSEIEDFIETDFQATRELI